MNVKDLLKNDLPPTNADAKMRRDHTMGSIEHQLRHIRDHAKALAEQLGKLHTVDSKTAHSEATRALSEVEIAIKDVKDCQHKGGCT